MKSHRNNCDRKRRDNHNSTIHNKQKLKSSEIVKFPTNELENESQVS